MLVYELSKVIIDCTSKEFMEFLNKVLNQEGLDVFKSQRKGLTTYWEENSKHHKDIWVKSVAHKDTDILNQVDVIEDLNWSGCIELLLNY